MTVGVTEKYKKNMIEASKVIIECDGNIKKAALKMHLPYNTIWKRWDRAKQEGIVNNGQLSDIEIKNDKKNTGEIWKETITDEERVIETTDIRITTVEDAVKKANIDTDVWEVIKVVVNGWDVSAKFGEEGNYKWSTKQNYQLKVWLKRRIPKFAEEFFDNFIKRAKKFVPRYKRIKRIPPQNPHLLVLSMPDSHFGMQAWHKETGEDYDTEIASDIYMNAGIELLNRASGYVIDKIILVVGNDLFHANDSTNLTPKSKNELDIDGRMAKVFEEVATSHIKLIKHLLPVAPVELIWIKGNHDPESSWYLAKYLEGFYTNCEDVTVNTLPAPQKHIKYGINLLAWTHGDEEKHRDLPALMAGKWPKDWATTKHREWQLGHFHKKKEMWTVIGDELGAGVRVRIIPSLTTKDYWHTNKGYMSIRSAEAFLYSKDKGYTGHFAVNVFDGKIS